MARVSAYGDITITDLTDVGRITSYLTSSLPLTVLYNPNQTPSYNPNWETTNLVLTPTIFFNDTLLSLTASGLTITWQRQAGSGSVTNLVSGESPSNGKLIVSKNVLEATPIITYICNISYIDPNTNGVEIKSKSQMSFSLSKSAPELSDCSINGDTVFKYNGEGALTSAKSITLTANLVNTSLKQWQYKKADGSFAVYPNSTTTTQLVVNATDDVFINDIAIIKLVTSDNDIYDIHQIVKLRDGAAGSATITCILSNDTQSVPCRTDGSLYDTSLNGCDTVISILKGADNDTSNWTITATPSTGVSGTYDSKGHKYTVTAITPDSGYVEFTCTRTGYATITKRFSINKDRSGSDGQDAVIYSVSSDVSFMQVNKNEVFVPSAITFTGKKIIGNNTATIYSGRFKIYESADGSTYSLKYTSTSDEQSKIYNPSTTAIKTIKCELYQSGNTTKMLDDQTVSVVKDGKDGEDGKEGPAAINVILGNSHEGIACNSSGVTLEEKNIEIPFDCYSGSTRIAGKATVGTPLPSGVTIKSNTEATASAGGMIVLNVKKGSTLFSANSGDITITFTASGLTSVHKFQLSKTIQADAGENAVSFQVYCSTGSVIYKNLNEDFNTVTLCTRLIDGSTVFDSMTSESGAMLTDESGNILTSESGETLIDDTNPISYQWYKYVGSGYKELAGKTNSFLTVTADMVDSKDFFRCSVTYKGKTYYGFWEVTDRTDPITCEPYSTLGTQLVNGVGVGCIYARVEQNGVEVDLLKSDVFSITAPTGATKGDFFYKIDKATKSVTLMKYNGTTWEAATSDDLPICEYKWYRRDSLGNAKDSAKPYATAKVIYLDKDVVDGKTTFGCFADLEI